MDTISEDDIIELIRDDDVERMRLLFRLGYPLNKQYSGGKGLLHFATLRMIHKLISF